MELEINNLYRVITLKAFRHTPGVAFDVIPKNVLPRVDGVDRVIHQLGALSPGPVGPVKRPWYMHPWQDDNLMVLAGIRYVDIYTPAHGRVEHFDVYPDQIIMNGKQLYDGPAMLLWPKGVFHRIRSDDETGSASVNLATRYEYFDLKTNFNIYDVDTATGQYEVIRDGVLDQSD